MTKTATSVLRPLLWALLVTAVFSLQPKPAWGAESETDASDESIVFTKFYNISKDSTFDYLSILLPNAFASSFRKTGHTTINATQSHQLITDNYPDFRYPPDRFMLRTLASELNAEFLITGSFLAQEGTITLNFMIYGSHADELLTFSIDGPIESKMFTLVDNMNRVISHLAIANYSYKTEKISKNSRIAVFSNLIGEDYNQLLQAFLSSGNRVACTQASDINTYMPNHQFYYFSSLATEKNSIERNYAKGAFELTCEPWKTARQLNAESEDIKLAHYYYNNASKITEQSLSDLSAAYGYIDYVFFINMSWDTGRFWLRCYSTEKKELIWIESGEIVDGEKKHSYAKTASYILSRYDYLSR